MKRFVASISVVALAACSKSFQAAPITPPTAGSERSVMAGAGDDAALRRFEAALRRCGVVSFNRNGDGQAIWVEVRGTTDALFATEGPLPCSIDWLLRNQSGLTIIGNKMRER